MQIVNIEGRMLQASIVGVNDDYTIIQNVRWICLGA